MKIAIIGYGKMGKEIEVLAKEKKEEVVAIIDPALQTDFRSKELDRADVCIDFTTPSSVLANCRILAEMRKNIVIGTTGWNVDDMQEIVEKNDIGVVYAQNFSLGMNLFASVLSQAALLINDFEDYDVCLHETHHKEKVDSPSGTALYLAEKMSRKVPISSSRVGTVFGVHEIKFDSPFDSITLMHEAKNRRGWAAGALFAAHFIHGKKGLYHFEEAIYATT